MAGILEYHMPKLLKTPVILSAPHGGLRFPSGFIDASPLSRSDLLATADKGTDQLVKSFEGIPYLSANFARSFVDLNRARSQIDSCVVEDFQSSWDTSVLSGYGVIPRYAEPGKLVQTGKMTRSAAEERLSCYYDPFHQRLEQLISHVVKVQGRAILLDVHSAPAFLMNGCDVVLGDQCGKSCAPKTIDGLAQAFDDAKLISRRNVPFAGGFITQTYSERSDVEVVQIEINRKLLESHSREIDSIALTKFAKLWEEVIKRWLQFQ